MVNSLAPTSQVYMATMLVFLMCQNMKFSNGMTFILNLQKIGQFLCVILISVVDLDRHEEPTIEFQ